MRNKKRGNEIGLGGDQDKGTNPKMYIHSHIHISFLDVWIILFAWRDMTNFNRQIISI